MDIVTREQTTHWFEFQMTLDEAREALQDPDALLRELRRVIRLTGTPVNGDAPKENSRRTRRASQRKKYRKPAKTPCEVCGKEISPLGMKNHMKMHDKS